MPRLLEFLFLTIHERQKDNPNLKYLIKCNYLEIYNEKVIDLVHTFLDFYFILILAGYIEIKFVD